MARLSRVISKNKGDGKGGGGEGRPRLEEEQERERRAIKSKWESNPGESTAKRRGRKGSEETRVATRFLFRGRSWHLESSRGLPRCKHLACVVT